MFPELISKFCQPTLFNPRAKSYIEVKDGYLLGHT